MSHIFVDNMLCNGCGKCVEKCLFGAINIINKKASIGDNCRLCEKCVKECPYNAIKINKENIKNIDKSKWKHILVYIECNKHGINPVSFQIIGKAFELSEKINFKVYGVVIGHNIEKHITQFDGLPLEKVFIYDDENFENFQTDVFSIAFEDCINRIMPSVVLIGATPIGKAIAPYTATKFHTGVTADCTKLEIRDNTDLVQIRPAFGGNIMAQIITPYTRPQFTTVRNNVMSPAEKTIGHKVQLVRSSICLELISSKITYLKNEDIIINNDIADEKVLIAIGNGVKNKSDIEQFEEYAKILGGQLACSRGLVEKGWMPYEKQIGLSGKTVKPNLLIACGVSGSVQFLAGIRGAKNIVAINSDSEAKIFSVAHYPICADLYEIMQKLVKHKELSNL